MNIIYPELEGGLVLRRYFKGVSVYLLIIILIMFGLRMMGTEVEPVSEMDVTELIRKLKNSINEKS